MVAVDVIVNEIQLVGAAPKDDVAPAVDDDDKPF